MQAVGKDLFMLEQTPSGVGMLSTLLVLTECEETRSEMHPSGKGCYCKVFRICAYCAVALAQQFCIGAHNRNLIKICVVATFFFPL